MSPALHVVIASSQQLLREALAIALGNGDGYAITTLTSDPSAVFECLQRTNADIVLLTRNSEKDDLLPTLSRLSEETPAAHVLILGDSDTAASISTYLEAGAKGYLTDDTSVEELKGALRKVMRGEVVCSDGAARFLVGRLARLSNKHTRLREIKSVTLTFRELEILGLVAKGYTNEQVGLHLSISVHTVKNHVHNMLEKLEVESRLQAVHVAYEKRWLRLNPARPQGSS